MPLATVTDSGTTPVIPSTSVQDATCVILQNNNLDVDIFVRPGSPVSSTAENAGIMLKRGGGSMTISSGLGNGGAPKLAIYAMHNGTAGTQKPLNWTKLTV